MTSLPLPDVLVVGSACPLLTGRCWSSFVVGGRVLIEAPPMVPQRLHELGLDPLALDAVVISHLHGDHFAGLPFLLLEYDVVTSRVAPLRIVGPPGTQARIEALFEVYYPGWAQEVDRGYSCEFHEMRDGETLQMGDFLLRAVEVDHGLDPDQALGFRIEGAMGSIGFSGDTRYTDALLTVAHEVDILIVDCTHANPTPGATHLSFTEIVDLRARLPRSTEIVLTHLGALLPDNIPVGIRVPLDGELLQCRAGNRSRSHR